MRDRRSVVDRPEILIVEGLNVLQPAHLPVKVGATIPFVSDFIDFSIQMRSATTFGVAKCGCFLYSVVRDGEFVHVAMGSLV